MDISSVQVDCQLNSSSNETFFYDNSLSFDGFGDGNADFVFNDNPLGMILPATSSLSISHGLLYPSLPMIDGGMGISPYPSLRLNSFLPENGDVLPPIPNPTLSPTDRSQSNELLSDRSQSNELLSDRSQSNELLSDRSQSNELSSDFSNGPLPQGSIRNIEMALISPDEILKGFDQTLPLLSFPSFSPFDPPYLPDSGDSQSDYLMSSESDIHSDSFSQNKKGKQNRKQKKWSCSECCYLNNLKTKRCVNCGSQSPFIHPKTPKGKPRKISPLPSSDPEPEPEPEPEIEPESTLNDDHSLSLRDFPYAYIPSQAEVNSLTSTYMIRSRKSEPRICSMCGSTNTPKWRRSPPPLRLLLCNACGLQCNKDASPYVVQMISPLEECQGEYCKKARAEGKNIRRRLFNRNILFLK